MIRTLGTLLLTVAFFAACNRHSEKKKKEVKETVVYTAGGYASCAELPPKPAGDEEETDKENEIANYYVVIADTGVNYWPLHSEMFRLSKALNTTIDTMERTYNPVKNLIALPDDYKDDIYQGDYYPRRYPSKTLSIEKKQRRQRA